MAAIRGETPVQIKLAKASGTKRLKYGPGLRQDQIFARGVQETVERVTRMGDETYVDFRNVVVTPTEAAQICAQLQTDEVRIELVNRRTLRVFKAV